MSNSSAHNVLSAFTRTPIPMWAFLGMGIAFLAAGVTLLLTTEFGDNGILAFSLLAVGLFDLVFGLLVLRERKRLTQADLDHPAGAFHHDNG